MFKMCFDPVVAVLIITIGSRICTFMKSFLEGSLCLTPFCQRYFGLTSCIIFMKEFISLTMVTIEIAKRQFLSYHSNGCYKEKGFIKNLNFIDSNYQCKTWPDWISLGWHKILQPRKCKFWKKGRES